MATVDFELLVLCFLFFDGVFMQENGTCKSYRTRTDADYSMTPTIAPVSKSNSINTNYGLCRSDLPQQEPQCFLVKSEIIPECPSDFTDGNNICYMLLPPSTFPPKCPFENILPFDDYKDLVSTDGSPIWLPVRRNPETGLFEWTEASKLYRTEFKRVYDVTNNTLKDKNCMIYNNNNYNYSAVSCEEEHRGVCAYSKLNEMTSPFCDNSLFMCKQSDFSYKSKCFCLGNSAYNSSYFPNKAKFIKPYQNEIYEMLTSDNCTIGLEKVNGTYIWNTTEEEIQYCFWSQDVVFDDLHIYGAMTTTGWILTEEPLPCFIFETPPQLWNPKLLLTYRETGDVGYLNLRIVDPEGLKELEFGVRAYCFTTASSLSPIYRYISLVENQTNLVYQFEPYKQGPGYYWCEAFSYLDPRPLHSDRIFVNQSGYYGSEFVAIFNLGYIPGTNPLASVNVINFLERILYIKLTELRDMNYTYTSRIMKIVNVDDENNFVSVNFHFTRLGNSTSLSEEEEYDQMKNAVEEMIETLEAVDISLKRFESATYCRAENSTNLTWPKCRVNHSVKSDAYCFKDGLHVSRSCIGNYIDIPEWSAPIDDCEIPTKTDVTDLLIDMQNDVEMPDIHEDIAEISNRYEEFNYFDVFLLAKIMKNSIRSDSEEMDISMFAKTLDNLFKINETILKDAQESMRAMDMVFDVIISIDFSENITSGNFSVVSSNDDDLDPVVLLDNGDVIEIEDIDDIFEVENLQVAINLDLGIKPISAPSKVETIIYKFFYNDVFFSDLEYSHRIIGVSFPGHGPNHSVEILFRINSTSKSPQLCVYWCYDLKKEDGYGKWNSIGPAMNNSTFLSCIFPLEVASAVTILSQTPTQDLEDLLGSNETSSKIIGQLSALSDRYLEFTSRDVYLVGRILQRISDDQDIDLDDLAHIINNVHEIEREILSRSQEVKWATDTILHSIDTILQNHQYRQKTDVSTKNFKILITNLEDTDFTGLLLYINNETLETETLEGDVDLDSILENDNITSVLLLTSDLKQQLDKNTTIKVTIFSHDGLFNENTTNASTVSKIFGVILPNLEEYQGPIRILHKLSTDNYESRCVHWSFDRSQNVTGLWKTDNSSESLSSFSQCDFWHTTHFALLLLEQDLYDDVVLNWITTINCGLSTFGLCVIILTAILFKRWRTNSGNQILLNFVCALLIQINVFYISNSINKRTNSYVFCTIIGVILHYSIISQFCWMFIIAILQFKRYVEVLTAPPKHVLLKGCLCGWGLPCLPVACVYFLDNDNYVNGLAGLCYPSDLGLYLGVWLPIGIIMAINLVIFLYIIYNVVHRKTECVDVGNNEAMFQWRLAVLLFFMLGLTWSFGFLSMEADVGVVFVYLFCITATLQGFMMFLFFIVFNSNTRYLYSHAIKKLWYDKNY